MPNAAMDDALNWGQGYRRQGLKFVLITSSYDDIIDLEHHAA